MSATTKDPATQSNYDYIATQQLHLDWTIDWPAKRIAGSVTHTLKAKANEVDKVIFDSSFLDIHDVFVEDIKAQYTLGAPHSVLGSALVISLPSKLRKGDTILVKINYSTTKEGTAVGWLDKQQTAGKSFSYLFSQCQPIYARCLAPIQDTPSVKLTYTATVKSILPVLLSAIRVSPPSESVHGGKELGVDVVEYVYKQPIPIPSYLIAIASGNLIYKPFPEIAPPNHGHHWLTGVWTEPELIDAAYSEFSVDTARFVSVAEALMTGTPIGPSDASEKKVEVKEGDKDDGAPYVWGVYDLLVLPPSFPFGGMENACLTFVTPTLLAGDRSLVDVVAHEIAHSWFGNNVTSADSGHVWLNEGWTTYTERILRGIVRGDGHLSSPAFFAERDFSYIIGRKSLQRSLEGFDTDAKHKRYQRLVIDYEFGEDPDDAFSRVPYDKGSNFLYYLERLLGGLDIFLPYVRDYVKTFRGTSIRTEEWKEHLYAYFTKYDQEHSANKVKTLDDVDWNTWFHGEGLSLPVENEYNTSLASEAYKLAEKWVASREFKADDLEREGKFSKEDVAKFSSNQMVVFLERLADLDSSNVLPTSHLTLLTKIYSLSTSTNVEIRLRFYLLVLKAPKDHANESVAARLEWTHEAAAWVVGAEEPRNKSEGSVNEVGKKGAVGVKGRMKFCRPVLQAVAHVDKEYAQKVWKEHRAFFHPIAQRMIDKDLGFSPNATSTR